MRPRALLALGLLLLTACTTLPGYQGGPAPRSTQYTYPGRGAPGSGGAAMPVVGVPQDGGTFVYGLVYWDGSTSTSLERWASFDDCERERDQAAGLFAERVQIGGRPVMTVKCFRAHETGPGAQQTR